MLLHAKVIGQGQPLIILHGLFGSSDNWITLGKKFSGLFQVHLMDLRNHGRSFHTDEMNYTLMVNDLCYYIAHYQLKNIILLGHSMGGKVAMKLAAEHPKIIEKLLVADIAPKVYLPHHQHIIKALLSVDFSEISTRKEVNQVLGRYIDKLSIRQFILKNVYWKVDKQLAFRMNVPVLAKYYNQLMGFDLSGQFHRPVLFLKGEKSFYIQLEDLPHIHSFFPHAKITTITKAGHWLHAENPNDFYTEVIRFITEK